MVTLKATRTVGKKIYLSFYHKHRFLEYVGEQSEVTPEKINHIKRRLTKECKKIGY